MAARVDCSDPEPAPPAIGVPLVYLRRGYASCIITLCEDGSIAGAPGHAEAHWSRDGASLVLRDAEGAETGRLEPQESGYAGRILDGIAVTLHAAHWPFGYRFDGALGERLAAIRQAPPMRYLLGMPFVNRRDLLERAVASVPALRHHLVIVDNSAYRELRGRRPAGEELVYEPPVPLSFVQSMNLLQQMAHEADCDVLCYMHNDAEAEPGMDRLFLDQLTEAWRTDPEFGVMFTHYDTLAGLSMAAVRRIGPWDSLFTGYFADNEYYARLARHGFKRVQSDARVIHHASMTIKTDPRLGHANAVLFPAYERLFEELCR